MLKGLGNLADMFRQMSSLRGKMSRINEQMERVNEALKHVSAEGASGGGMVKVRVNGKLEMLDCKIDPAALADDDREMLEDLIVSAVNQAIDKARAAAAEQLSAITSDIDLSSFIPPGSAALEEIQAAFSAEVEAGIETPDDKPPPKPPKSKGK